MFFMFNDVGLIAKSLEAEQLKQIKELGDGG